MHSQGTRKCRHCGDFFIPDARNRARQRYCPQRLCRKASKADSQSRWLSKPENADYFRSEQNATRVREWQAANPEYWKRGDLCTGLLQDLLITKTPANQGVTAQDEKTVLQDLLAAQLPVLVGLVSQLAGTVLQDELIEIVRRFASRGSAILHPGPSSLQREK